MIIAASQIRAALGKVVVNPLSARACPEAPRGQVRSLGEGVSQSPALTPCTRARARHSTTLLPGTRAHRSARAQRSSPGTAPITGSAHPSRAQVHREPHACEDAGDGRQDGAAHGHPGVDDRRFKQQLPSAAVLFTRQAAPHHVTGASQQGRPSRWRVSSAPGGRSPRTTVTPGLRLRFRHLTTSDKGGRGGGGRGGGGRGGGGLRAPKHLQNRNRPRLTGLRRWFHRGITGVLWWPCRRSPREARSVRFWTCFGARRPPPSAAASSGRSTA